MGLREVESAARVDFAFKNMVIEVRIIGVVFNVDGQGQRIVVTKFAVLWIRKCARILRAAGGHLSPLTP